VKGNSQKKKIKEKVLDQKEVDYVYYRSRSVAIVIRDGKILMERVVYFGREFFTVPGGGIEDGETPEQAVLRELKEECGLDGKIVRPLAKLYKSNGTAEYSFEVEVSREQEAITGYDPEESSENPPLKEVLWMSLDEIPEKDRAFLWSYGLIGVGDFFSKIKSWGDEISYPVGKII
jgi:8-oxo-dGTP pyrophosphatase MutT (NUDIX family)